MTGFEVIIGLFMLLAVVLTITRMINSGMLRSGVTGEESQHPPDEEQIPVELCHNNIPDFKTLPRDEWDYNYVSALELQLKTYNERASKQRAVLVECDQCDANYHSHHLVQTQHTIVAVEHELDQVLNKIDPDYRKH